MRDAECKWERNLYKPNRIGKNLYKLRRKSGRFIQATTTIGLYKKSLILYG